MKKKMTESKRMRPAFKIHGGKFYLNDWIISLFPKEYPEMDYIEPFVGAGSVLLNKAAVESQNIEVINDLDVGVVQIFRALRDEPEEFVNLLKKIKYSEKVFDRELKRQGQEYEDYMDHAVSEFIVRRMSRGGLKKAFGWSDRERGGQPGDVNAWKTIIKLLPSISERLSRVKIFNKQATKIISAFDSDNTLVYVDPPYPAETRTSQAYEHEMTTEQHEKLADELMKFRGKVIISSYTSPLYEKLYGEWRCEKKKIPNHSSQQKVKQIKTEVCWMNY